MPLKLVSPRAGKSPFYYVRGTHLRVAVDRSTKTSRKSLAKKILREIEREIETGAFGKSEQSGFAGAAQAYMMAGGENRFVKPLIEHFRMTPLSEIGQQEIDLAAVKIYPVATSATRNRQVYSPMSAILKRAGVETKIKRPIGWRGGKRTFFLMPDPAFALLDAARAVNVRFWVLCTILLYCGLRLSEGLGIEKPNIHVAQKFFYIPDTKTGEPRAVYMPAPVLDALNEMPGGIGGEGKLFTFHKCGRLYEWLDQACEAAHVVFPPRTAFHAFRHTYGTWMRLFGKLDDIGLIRTRAWSDLESVERYSHSLPMAEAKAADLLPVPAKRSA
jgi:integrase